MLCTTLENFKSLTSGEDIVVLDIETKGNKYFSSSDNTVIMGTGIYLPKTDVGIYVPVNEYVPVDDTIVRIGEPELLLEVRMFLDNSKVICHNSSFDIGWLNYCGSSITPYWDTRIAWQLLSPEGYKETSAYSLDKAIESYLNKESHKGGFEAYLASIGASAKDGEHYKAETKVLAEYCIKDCKTTYEIYSIQKPKIEDLKAYDFMHNLFDYQSLLNKQYQEGILFNSKKAESYKRLLERYTNYLNKKIYKLAKVEISIIENKHTMKKANTFKSEKGKNKFLADADRKTKFNLNSRQHMADLLEELDINVTELTGSGKTKTDKHTLNKYSKVNPVIDVLVKLNKTQTDSRFITQYMEATINGRYHPDMDICGTASGRLTCFKPNILAVNRRDKRLMRCFCAPDGYKFVQWDLSNIEPRIEAHFARDKELAEIVTTGKDIYLELLKYIYPDKVYLYNPNDLDGSKKRLHTERDMLKKIRLAMGYGAQPNKVALILNIPLNEARRIYNAYWGARQASKNLENRLLTLYAKQGYIQNMWQRPITMAFSKDILNRFVQSSAHDTLMQLNLMLDAELKKQRIKYLPTIIDFHDENITAVKDEDIEAYLACLADVFKKFNNKLNLLAPLDYDYKIVSNFSELK